VHPRRLQLQRPDARARFAVPALLIVGLAGCATTLSPRLGSPEASYIGVFTGEFVDGRPLYRFPTIEVVGSRRSVTDDELRERDPS
jgi:hypothetical protein